MIERWKIDLEKAGHAVCLFNAWETDYSEEPLIAFMAEIISKLKGLGLHEGDNQYKSILKNFGEYAWNVGAQKGLEAISQGTIDLNKLKKIFDTDQSSLGDLTKKRLESHLNAKKSVLEFQKYLSEAIVQYLGNQEEDDKETSSSTAQEDTSERSKNLVILVDELDRCRPEYAVSLLEQIKHLFAVHGTVFVLAVDPEQLSNVVRTVNGSVTDTENYLRKFIDWNIALPEIPTHHYGYAAELFKRFGLDQFLDHNFDQLVNLFWHCSRLFDLSLREQEQCCTQINLLLRDPDQTGVYFSSVAILLLTLKTKDSYLYKNFCLGDSGYKSVWSLLKSNTNAFKSIEKQEKEFILTLPVYADIRSVQEFRARHDTLIKELNQQQNENPGTHDVQELREEVDIQAIAMAKYTNTVQSGHPAKIAYELIEWATNLSP